ncbi:sigma-54 interaction domain-containing protein [Bacillus altitudinis]|uniref:sigma-54 interaction domain-containing protein n=1 Tax=Bacillus altitudinis TaxID=293387 RepID=UPI002DB86FB7|nr:sigma 54-interacting transcriptional regulator [Bacillus altitudinis]MEC0970597.1 sigma 54-interacting transcriptional regulator [Bacillus altitudinis]MEC1002451.1 sigma 54-interacting transcriptional regulator [Bacillus altitudinis]
MGKVVERADWFELILEAIDEAIHVVDDQGVTIFYNHNATKFDCLAKEEVISKYILDVYPSLTEKTSTLMHVLRTGKPIYHSLQTYLNKNGEKIETVNTTLPIMEGSKLIGAVEVAKDVSKLSALSNRLDQKKRTDGAAETTQMLDFSSFLTNDPHLKEMLEKAKKAAAYPSSVMVFGETGTGKEVLVQAIVHASDRKDQVFIPQNCAALPESLLESLLFGSVKGSYTGAIDRKGLFELADGGTLFLDELQAMPLTLQTKLLRVLEDGVVRRIGDAKAVQVNVRVITALNIDPFEAVKKQMLREDLFYRLHVSSFHIPPLRTRKHDIQLLSRHFIQTYHQQFSKNVNRLSEETVQVFMAHQWPGNVRELKHTIEHAVLMMPKEAEEITPAYLPGHLRTYQIESHPPESSLKSQVTSFEQMLIQEALRQHAGNIKQTAAALKIPRQTLQYKLKKYTDAEK